MRKLSFFLWALLLVDGVFGVKKEEVPVSVSVMEGDSVTLNPSTEIPEDDTILWLFGKESIAQMNKADGLFSTSEGDRVGFKDRLELDHQTGSLTITNITNTDSGLYQLEIRSRIKISKNFTVSVRDVVESVSVMEGDTVTLHTGVTDKQRDVQTLHPMWKFKDDVIPTDGLNGGSYLNDQTKDLTIRNIRRDQSGVYELKINTNSLILHRKLHITVTGEMKTVSVTEGEPIILYTGVKIQGYDLILWKFEDHLIAEINKEALPHDSSAGGRFKGRLQPSEQSGSLTIRDSRTTDSGDYHLNMSSSSHTVQRNISVTVSESTDWRTIAIVLITVIAVIAVIAIILAIKKNCGSGPSNTNSNVPVNGQT